MANIAFLQELEQLIRARLRESPEGSYTAGLAGKGIVAVAQKVGEEGVELALAAVAEGRQKTIDESADLLFHVLLLLAVKDIPLDDVIATLEQRHRNRMAK
jgi:phosphoribosyl-AMP cyclohydrolase / phosphoribosyl-ATP pyrophosphohydrolase